MGREWENGVAIIAFVGGFFIAPPVDIDNSRSDIVGELLHHLRCCWCK